MNRSGWWLALTLLAALPVRAESADGVVAAHLAARGGADKLRAVRSLRWEGRVSNVHGGGATMRFEWKHPGAVRVETTLQGKTMIQATDGREGWLVVPFQGSSAAQPATEEDLARLARSAELDTLLDAAACGSRVELIGRESWEGTPVDHLRVTRADGEAVDLFLDAKSHLTVRESGTSVRAGFEARYEVTLSDYKEIGGVLFPFVREVRSEGMPRPQVTELDRLELNVTLPDERFAMPATASGGAI